MFENAHQTELLYQHFLEGCPPTGPDSVICPFCDARITTREDELVIDKYGKKFLLKFGSIDPEKTLGQKRGRAIPVGAGLKPVRAVYCKICHFASDHPLAVNGHMRTHKFETNIKELI